MIGILIILFDPVYIKIQISSIEDKISNYLNYIATWDEEYNLDKNRI